MRFEPKTEEEVKRGKLLRPGECDFEVKQAQEELSSNGNPMIKVTLQVWDADGEQATVFDYIMEAMAHKLRHFAYAVGLGHEYEQGELSDDNLIGKGGRCIIRTEQDKAKQYPPKNVVADYLLSDRTKETSGYKQAKARDNGDANTKPAGPSTRQKAWQDFQAANKGKTADELATLWRSFIKELYPNVTNSNDLTPANWANISNVIKHGPAVSTISTEAEFREDDIPF